QRCPWTAQSLGRGAAEASTGSATSGSSARALGAKTPTPRPTPKPTPSKRLGFTGRRVHMPGSLAELSSGRLGAAHEGIVEHDRGRAARADAHQVHRDAGPLFQEADVLAGGAGQLLEHPRVLQVLRPPLELLVHRAHLLR